MAKLKKAQISKVKKAKTGTSINKVPKALPVNIPAKTIQSPNAMGPSGTTLDNVNVRPTRWQTAKYDAKAPTKSLASEIKSELKSKNLGEKAKGALRTASAIGASPAVAALSLYNVASGQARYNKNKRADLSSVKKNGGMIKRADGSMSKRGLWDNIRANKGSGKAPTAAMLKQEKKIKANTKKK
jgi:hypothetical protein